MRKTFPYHKGPPPPHYRVKKEASSCPASFWLVFTGVLILGALISVVIVIATRPYPLYGYYRDTHPQGLKGTGPRVNCTVGEVFDSSLELCAPKSGGISEEIKDGSVGVCESFFHHMSGKWISSHENENRGFTYVYRKNRKEMHDLIRDPTSGPVYNFYRSCLDTLVHGKHTILEEEAIRHVKEEILGSLHSHEDLPITFARLARYGFGSPFLFVIELHPTELAMVPMVRFDDFPSSGSVGEVLRSWHAQDADWEGSYVEYVQSARYLQDMSSMGALLDASPPNFWKLYLRELNGYQMEEDLDITKQPLWFFDRHYMLRLLQGGLKEISIEEWRTYTEASIDYHMEQFLPNLPAESYFRIHNPVSPNVHYRHRLARNDEISEEACITATHKLLPGLTGNLFLARTMPNHTQIKVQVTQIVENIRDAFAELIGETPWLSAATREKAVDKIRAIIVRSVVPTYYETEPFANRLSQDHYLRNLNWIRRYFASRNYELWTKGPPNRDLIQRFGAPLTEVNAFYSPSSNTITIFAGILNEPFYSPHYDEVELYATIGMIAGHELAHALDNTGRLFDKDGSLSREEPWTKEEKAEFDTRCACIVKEYVAPLGCDNARYGEQTLGEDLADVHGIKSALLALSSQKSFSQSARRKFFSIFAQMWAETYSQELLCERVQDDVHAIAMYRVDKTLRQLREFREAFGCKAGDKMVNSEPCVVLGGGGSET